MLTCNSHADEGYIACSHSVCKFQANRHTDSLTSNMDCAHAVMHHEACETSWRPAGFRTINQTEYLGCIPNEDHPSWDPEQDDPEFIPETKPPKQQPHEKALLKANSAGDSGTLAHLLCHILHRAENVSHTWTATMCCCAEVFFPAQKPNQPCRTPHIPAQQLLHVDVLSP